MNIFFRSYDKPGIGIDPDKEPEKGIKRYFEMLRIEWKQLLLLNLLYLLFCIPIVTIPASTAAMTRITLYMAEDTPRFLWYDFWKTFRREWKRASLLGGAHLIFTILTGFGTVFYRLAAKGNVYMMLPCVIMGITFVFLWAMEGYLYSMLVLTDLKLKVILKNAFLLLFVPKGGVRSVYVILFTVGLFLITTLFMPYSLVLLVLFFSLVSLMASFCSLEILKKHVLKSEKDTEPEKG